MLPGQQQMMGAGLDGSPFMDPRLAEMPAAGIRPPGIPGPHQQLLDASRAPADRRLLEQPWKDPRWFPITIDSVMAYFCQRDNPFYDNSSDNALVAMQNMGTGISGPQLDDMLKRMTGIQYVLVQPPSSAPLFVIRKQQRMSPDKITPLCHYYILDGTVYQAPDMHTFLHSRMISIMDPLRNAFTETLEMLRFTPSKGHFWEFKTKPSKRAEDEDGMGEEESNDYLQMGKDEKSEDPLNVRATPYQRLRTDMLLQQLAIQFKPEKMEIDNMPAQPDFSTFSAAGPNPSSSTSQQPRQNGFGTTTDTTPMVDFQGLLFGAQSSIGVQQQQHSVDGQS